MLQEQLAAMAGMSGSGPKSSSKMPVFDLVKDKETFKLWKSRWEIEFENLSTKFHFQFVQRPHKESYFSVGLTQGIFFVV